METKRTPGRPLTTALMMIIPLLSTILGGCSRPSVGTTNAALDTATGTSDATNTTTTTDTAGTMTNASSPLTESMTAELAPPDLASRPLREIIVSYSDGTNKRQLYRINEDGSARRRITDGTHDCAMPE